MGDFFSKRNTEPNAASDSVNLKEHLRVQQKQCDFVLLCDFN